MTPFIIGLIIFYVLIALMVFFGVDEYLGNDYSEKTAFISAIIWPILLLIYLVKFIIWLVWNSLKRIKEVICG